MGNMEEKYQPKNKLEKWIISGITSQNKLVKGMWYLPAVYVGGSLFGEGMDAFAGYLGLTSAQLTKRHAIIFGLVGMTLEAGALYLLGEETKEGMPGNISDWLNIPYKAAVGLYWSSFGIFQNSSRLHYVKKTGKGIGAMGLVPLVFNGISFGYQGGKKAWKGLRNSKGNFFESDARAGFDDRRNGFNGPMP